MDISIINRIEQLEEYEPCWTDILSETNNDNPFITYGWIESWWHFFGRDHELFILKLSDGVNVLGFCPLMSTNKGIFKEINFIGYHQTCYEDFIVRESDKGELVSSLIDFLNGLKGNYIFDLHGLQPDSSSLELINNYLFNNKVKYFNKKIPSFFIKMEGDSYNNFYKSRCKHHSIKSIKRYENRLNEIGNITWKKLNKYNLEELFKLHEKRWYKKNDGNGFSKGLKKDFYKNLFNNTNNRYFKTVANSLWIDNRIIGINYGFECNGRYISHRIAHDDDFQTFSLGKIVSKNMIKDAFEKGIKKYDFSSGFEKHKIEWTDNIIYISSVVFASENIVSKVILLSYYIEENLRNYLKQFKFLVDFKKIYFGRFKYLFTYAFMSNLRNTINNEIYNKGLYSSIKDCIFNIFGRVINYQKYQLFKISSGYFYKSDKNEMFTVERFEISLLDKLSDLMNITSTNITRRLYKGHKCFIFKFQEELIGYAWVSYSALPVEGINNLSIKEPIDICIHDIFIIKKYKDSKNLKVFINLLLEHFNDYKHVVLQINAKNKQIINTAKDMGFEAFKLIHRKPFLKRI